MDQLPGQLVVLTVISGILMVFWYSIKKEPVTAFDIDWKSSKPKKSIKRSKYKVKLS